MHRAHDMQSYLFTSCTALHHWSHLEFRTVFFRKPALIYTGQRFPSFIGGANRKIPLFIFVNIWFIEPVWIHLSISCFIWYSEKCCSHYRSVYCWPMIPIGSSFTVKRYGHGFLDCLFGRMCLSRYIPYLHKSEICEVPKHLKRDNTSLFMWTIRKNFLLFGRLIFAVYCACGFTRFFTECFQFMEQILLRWNLCMETFYNLQ